MTGTEDSKKTCNCPQKDVCPLNENCLQSSVIYQATVTRKDNLANETYLGLTENNFKTRHRNHTASIRCPSGFGPPQIQFRRVKSTSRFGPHRPLSACGFGLPSGSNLIANIVSPADLVPQ